MPESPAPLVRVTEVMRRTGISRSSIHRLSKKQEANGTPAFPKPIKLGSAVVWDQGEIDAYIQKLKADR